MFRTRRGYKLSGTFPAKILRRCVRSPVDDLPKSEPSGACDGAVEAEKGKRVKSSVDLTRLEGERLLAK